MNYDQTLNDRSQVMVISSRFNCPSLVTVFTSMIFPSHVQYRDQFESIRFGELTIQVDCLCLQITLENSPVGIMVKTLFNVGSAKSLTICTSVHLKGDVFLFLVFFFQNTECFQEIY